MSKQKAETHWSSTLRYVNISELRIDPEAQRRLDPNWVKAHVSKFDPDQLGYIVVNKRADGKLYVIDGQHRVELLRAVGWGDQSIQCECFDGQTQANEAALFLRRNDRKSVRTFDKFRVSVTSGDDMHTDIDRIVRHQGLTVSDQCLEGHVVAVAALQRVYSGAGIGSAKEGPAALARTLKTIQRAWGKGASGFQGHLISGLGMVQLRYNGKLDQEALAEKLAPFPGGAPGLLGKAKAIQDMRGRPLHHCVASVIVDTYNKGRRVGKVQDWWA
jgi:hypothetical protein